MTNRHSTAKFGKKDIIDIPPMAKENEYPVAKYIVVSKVMDWRLTKHERRVMIKNRIYGIGILTDKNEYYYSQIRTKGCNLSLTMTYKILRIIKNRYRYTSDTRVEISDNMKIRDEPIALLLQILGSAFGIQIRKTPLLVRLKSINSYFNYIRPYHPERFKFAAKNKERMIMLLLDHDRFDFIRDKEWRYKLVEMDNMTRRANIECAVGILHMYVKDLRKEWIKNHEKRLKSDSVRVNSMSR